jgi:hypothetical protein
MEPVMCSCDRYEVCDECAPQPVVKPSVSVLDDELLIEFSDWCGVRLMISIDDDGIGYAVRDGDKFRPGVGERWSDMVADIKSALAK